jgi:hypothetical protein
MKFQRHLAGEAAQVAMGLRQMEMYFCNTGGVHYLIGHDVMHEHWTASYRVHPYTQPTSTFITDGGTELVGNTGTIYTYPSQKAAEDACYRTHRVLKGKLS